MLRIEDLDASRSRPEYADAIQRDFEALGLTWDEGPFYQHARNLAYQEAFECLQAKNLIYPCFCSRADLHSGQAPHQGETFVYQETCKHLGEGERRLLALRKNPSYRLTVSDESISFDDALQGKQSFSLKQDIGDFIVKRSDGGFAYQLACALDDAHQGVNLIVRGADLLSSTPQQVYIKRLFGYEDGSYAHLPLLTNEEGKRLAKRDRDAHIDTMLHRCGSYEGIIGKIACLSGMVEHYEALSAEDLLSEAKSRDIFCGLRNKECLIFRSIDDSREQKERQIELS